jgi:hypothetical protein
VWCLAAVINVKVQAVHVSWMPHTLVPLHLGPASPAEHQLLRATCGCTAEPAAAVLLHRLLRATCGCTAAQVAAGNMWLYC